MNIIMVLTWSNYRRTNYGDYTTNCDYGYLSSSNANCKWGCFGGDYRIRSGRGRGSGPGCGCAGRSNAAGSADSTCGRRKAWIGANCGGSRCTCWTSSRTEVDCRATFCANSPGCISWCGRRRRPAAGPPRSVREIGGRRFGPHKLVKVLKKKKKWVQSLLKSEVIQTGILDIQRWNRWDI